MTKPLRPRYREGGCDVHDAADTKGDGKQVRVTNAEHKPLTRPVTASGAIQYQPLRRSSLHLGRAAQDAPPTPPRTREEALAATMRSLQANSTRRSSISPSKLLERPSSAAADYAKTYSEVHGSPSRRPTSRHSGSGYEYDRSPSRQQERPASRLGQMSRLADVAEDREVLLSPRGEFSRYH